MRDKPKIKYTAMCIYIDTHIYTDNYDPNLVFKYLTWLFYALSFKKKFFNCEADYDGFALYGATQTFLRLTNKKQFLPDDDPKKLPKIKSVLNFIKKILYPAKVNYQQEAFNKVYDEELLGEGSGDSFRNYITSDINNTTDEIKKIEVEQYLRYIPKTLHKFLEDSPYSNDKIMMKNIYISCLLTLLRMFTLSNYNEKRLKNKDNTYRLNVDNLLEDMYYEENINAPVVWHLDKSMTSYIAVLCNKLKDILAFDIREICKSHELSEEVIQDILMLSVTDKDDE